MFSGEIYYTETLFQLTKLLVKHSFIFHNLLHYSQVLVSYLDQKSPINDEKNDEIFFLLFTNTLYEGCSGSLRTFAVLFSLMVRFYTYFTKCNLNMCSICSIHSLTRIDNYRSELVSIGTA